MDERPAPAESFQLFTEVDSPTGIDDFLLLELLRLSPAERLRRGQERAQALYRLQNATRLAK